MVIDNLNIEEFNKAKLKQMSLSVEDLDKAKTQMSLSVKDFDKTEMK